MPGIYIIAGPNGAGKTTFAEEFLPERCQEFVNADLIAKGLSPFHPEAAAFEAGRIMLSRIDELISRDVDLAFETTLSGRVYRQILRRARDRGYVVDLTFLWLPSADLAIARVARRVELGGYGVPDDVVRRRFGAGIRNLFAVYKDVVAMAEGDRDDG
jgi:predicted ABC-type ATPase